MRTDTKVFPVFIIHLCQFSKPQTPESLTCECLQKNHQSDSFLVTGLPLQAPLWSENMSFPNLPQPSMRTPETAGPFQQLYSKGNK